MQIKSLGKIASRTFMMLVDKLADKTYVKLQSPGYMPLHINILNEEY